MGKKYEDELQTNEWFEKRQEILKRDGYQCTKCGIEFVTMQVHHKFYYVPPIKAWQYEDDDLITLCKECHEEWHRNNSIQYKKAIIKNDFIDMNGKWIMGPFRFKNKRDMIDYAKYILHEAEDGDIIRHKDIVTFVYSIFKHHKDCDNTKVFADYVEVKCNPEYPKYKNFCAKYTDGTSFDNFGVNKIKFPDDIKIK